MQCSAAGQRTRSALVFITFALFVFPAAACAQPWKQRPQTTPQSTPNSNASPQQQMQTELMKHPEVLEAFGKLVQRLQAGVSLPGPRSESRLLPLAPKSTVFYAAFPNYGEAAMQALTIFRQEMNTSAVLRQWWQSGEMAKGGPQIEDAIEKFYRISQYLGDEIAITAGVEGNNPHGMLIAEIKKPGLKPVLQQAISQLAANTKTTTTVRVLDAGELATISDAQPNNGLLMLVRPDYLVVSSDAATLRHFNSRLDASTRDFAATPFGQRIAQAYQDRVTIVSGLDLQSILASARSASAGKQAVTALDDTGFSNVQYLVWEHANQTGQELSKSELSFSGPRHGIAAWLGGPATLGSLDFASSKAMSTVSVVLENPALIFDDVRRLITSANPNAFAGITQMEQRLHINLRDDLLRTLGGEITLELDGITPVPTFKAILRVEDPAHFEQTLNTIFASMQIQPEQFEDSGTRFHKIAAGKGQSVMEVTYALTDGYLVVASDPKTATEAVRLHRSGESLARSQRFRAALPPGHPGGVSALVFQDPTALAALQMRQVSPDMAAALAALSGRNKPAVMAAYASENSIRGESTSLAMDAGVVSVVAAIAIPNLLRSRMAANEAAAVSALRTINTAQATYAATYPDRGYAADLTTLGGGPGQPSADRAGLIDASLGCTSGWCEKSGYRFHIRAVCLQGQCPQYTVLATPINANTGARNLCTNSDGQIRFKAGPPLTTPINAVECRRWTSLP